MIRRLKARRDICIVTGMIKPDGDAKMKRVCRYRRYILAVLLCLVFVSPSRAFSILAHEAIIDASWTDQIRPLLLKRFPNATQVQLDSAHAYAYGGSLVADMGFMPFGSPYFTNLLHYVRSGDFVNTLLADAQNLGEYAFALGAVSHYMADKYGHALATNLSVSLFYPKLKKKFGDVVTYDDDHTSHSAMEFAFDVIQTVKGNYASIAYHNFIGFYIAAPVLKRAFRETYGQSLDTVFPNFESAVSNFRWGVRNLLPELERIAWKADKEGILQSRAGVSRKSFCYKMPKQAFDKEFNSDHAHVGLTARSMAFLIEAMPKVGPLKKIKFRYPGIACEKLFLQSMDTILVNYAAALHEAGEGRLALNNINYDTGKPSVLHEYAMADKAYKEWLLRLNRDKSARLTEEIQKSILAFYQKNNNKEQLTDLTIFAAMSQ